MGLPEGIRLAAVEGVGAGVVGGWVGSVPPTVLCNGWTVFVLLCLSLVRPSSDTPPDG